MAKKVIMTGTLGVMSEAQIERFGKMLTEANPGVEFAFLHDGPQDDATISKDAKGANVLITQYQPMSEDIYKALAPELQGVIAYGIGFNCANVPVASQYKIPVANIPDYCTDEVATHAITLIMAMQKRLPNLIKWIEEGKWGGGYKVMAPKKRFAGSTVGLYGYGRIPRLVAKAMIGMGVNVIAADPFVPADAMAADGVKSVDFDTLIKESDYLSLHAPALPSTIGVINKRVFEMMKPTAVLVNTGRGALVDPDALYEALTTGQIDSAALDAYITEPPTGIERKILELPNVLSTPHVGYFSDTAFDDLMEKTVQEATRMLNGEEPKNFVNRKDLAK